MPEQLCWSCAKACGGCSWSRKDRPEPVPGWTARQKVYKADGGTRTDGITYKIIKCPEYARDCLDSQKPRCAERAESMEEKKISLYNAKKSDYEIGRLLGLSHNAIYKWRVKTGRPSNRKPVSPKRQTPAPIKREPEWYQAAAALYAAGKNDGEIGRALGRSPETVYSWRKSTNRPAVTGRGRPKGEEPSAGGV